MIELREHTPVCPNCGLGRIDFPGDDAVRIGMVGDSIEYVESCGVDDKDAFLLWDDDEAICQECDHKAPLSEFGIAANRPNPDAPWLSDARDLLKRVDEKATSQAHWYDIDSDDGSAAINLLRRIVGDEPEPEKE